MWFDVQVSDRSLLETVDDNIHLNNLNGWILLHVEKQIYKCLKYWQIFMARVQTNFCSKICVIFSFSSFFSWDPYQGWGQTKTLSVQHHRFLPHLFCSCLTRLKLTVCHTDNVVLFDPSLAQHFLICTQHSSLIHLLNAGIALTGNHAQPHRHPKAFASFSFPRVGLL